MSVLQATETKAAAPDTKTARFERGNSPLRWLRRGPGAPIAAGGLTDDRRERMGLRDNGFSPSVFFDACPAVRLRGDESTHAPYVTAAHRCACAPDYVPDSVHQIVFCLTDSAHRACPRFDEAKAVRVVDDLALPASNPSKTRRRAALAIAAAALAAAGLAVTLVMLSASEEAAPRVAAAGESAAVTPVAAALGAASSPAVPAREPAAPAPASDPLEGAGEAALAARSTADLPGLAPLAPAEVPPQSYVVAPGDSLLAIAATFDVDLELLLEVNALSESEPILVGQVLQIPVPDPA